MAERQLAVVNQQAAAVTESEWSEARKKFVLDNYCNNAPPSVALVFMGEAMRRGLSPEAKQIYLIPRKDKQSNETRWITQTSIDGYRVIADRTRRYAGSDDALFVMRSDGRTPEKATMTVYKMVEGQRCPFTASAYWDEYNAGQNLWKTMPRVMLGKCAEGLALRKAFPAELSGLYTDAEMDQSGVIDARASVSLAPEPSRHADRATGEITAASDRVAQPLIAVEDEADQPCAIDDCSGACNGAWVGFSVRKYGVPLCSKHSAMAKHGELDGPLARLNEPKPTPIQTTAQLSQPVEAVDGQTGEITDKPKKADPLRDAKATLWREAQLKGLTVDLLGDYAQEALGSALSDMTTAAVVQLTQKLKREEAAMLLDRLTNRPAAEVIDGPDMFPDVEFAAEEKPDPWTR